MYSLSTYNKHGINWWDYCKPELINSYPTYFKKLPKLIAKINKEKRSSKNYVLFIGETGVETNQLPCLSLIQFQISELSRKTTHHMEEMHECHSPGHGW